MNYMGFSNAQQTPVYNVAIREAGELRKKIIELTEVKIIHLLILIKILIYLFF